MPENREAAEMARKLLHDYLHETLAVEHCAGSRPDTDKVAIPLPIRTWSAILDALSPATPAREPAKEG